MDVVPIFRDARRTVHQRPYPDGLLGELGDEVVVGIEGAGSYGTGLCEFLLAQGIEVVEVERPRREDRRRGKSDEIDALAAAKKVLANQGLSPGCALARPRRAERLIFGVLRAITPAAPASSPPRPTPTSASSPA